MKNKPESYTGGRVPGVIQEECSIPANYKWNLIITKRKSAIPKRPLRSKVPMKMIVIDDNYDIFQYFFGSGGISYSKLGSMLME